MNNRVKKQLISISILIFLLTFFAMLYFLRELNLRRQIEINKKERKFLGEIPKEKISSIKVKRIAKGVEENLLLTNKEGNWSVIYNVEDFANEEKIKTLINNISTLTAENIITNIENIDQYGLNPPFISVWISMFNESKIFYIGKRTVDREYFYASTPELNKIYLVPASHVEILLENFNNFREKEIFKIPFDEVVKVEITTPKGKYILNALTNGTKKEWVLFDTGKRKVEDFNERMIDIYSILISSYLDEDKPINDAPFYTIKLFSTNRTNTLYIFKKVNDDLWIAKSPDKKGLFLVSKSRLENLFEIGK